MGTVSHEDDEAYLRMKTNQPISEGSVVVERDGETAHDTVDETPATCERDVPQATGTPITTFGDNGELKVIANKDKDINNVETRQNKKGSDEGEEDGSKSTKSKTRNKKEKAKKSNMSPNRKSSMKERNETSKEVRDLESLEQLTVNSKPDASATPSNVQKSLKGKDSETKSDAQQRTKPKKPSTKGTKPETENKMPIIDAKVTKDSLDESSQSLKSSKAKTSPQDGSKENRKVLRKTKATRPTKNKKPLKEGKNSVDDTSKSSTLPDTAGELQETRIGEGAARKDECEKDAEKLKSSKARAKPKSMKNNNARQNVEGNEESSHASHRSKDISAKKPSKTSLTTDIRNSKSPKKRNKGGDEKKSRKPSPSRVVEGSDVIVSKSSHSDRLPIDLPLTTENEGTKPRVETSKVIKRESHQNYDEVPKATTKSSDKDVARDVEIPGLPLPSPPLGRDTQPNTGRNSNDQQQAVANPVSVNISNESTSLSDEDGPELNLEYERCTTFGRDRSSDLSELLPARDRPPTGTNMSRSGNLSFDKSGSLSEFFPGEGNASRLSRDSGGSGYLVEALAIDVDDDKAEAERQQIEQETRKTVLREMSGIAFAEEVKPLDRPRRSHCLGRICCLWVFFILTLVLVPTILWIIFGKDDSRDIGKLEREIAPNITRPPLRSDLSNPNPTLAPSSPPTSNTTSALNNTLCHEALPMRLGQPVSGSLFIAAYQEYPDCLDPGLDTYVNLGRWYKYVSSTSTRTVHVAVVGNHVSLQAYTIQSGFDECAPSGFRNLDCARDAMYSGGDPPQLVSFTAVQDVEYYFLVHETIRGQASQFELEVSSNDKCEGAFGPIEAGMAQFGMITQSGTIELDDNVPASCGDTSLTLGTSRGTWYVIVGDGYELIASTCQQTAFDTQISVYSGSCGALECVGGNDDACGSQSSISWSSIDGEIYYILVYGNIDTDETYVLQVSSTSSSVFLDGDYCANAIPIEPKFDFDNPTLVNLVDATGDEDVPCGSETLTLSGIWFSVIGTGKPFRASLYATASDFFSCDSWMAVLVGDCQTMVCVVEPTCGGGPLDEMIWETTADTEYYVFVGYDEVVGVPRESVQIRLIVEEQV